MNYRAYDNLPQSSKYSINLVITTSHGERAVTVNHPHVESHIRTSRTRSDQSLTDRRCRLLIQYQINAAEIDL